jgi:hypothetical protein
MPTERQLLSEGSLVTPADVNTSPETHSERVVLPIVGVGVRRITHEPLVTNPLPMTPPPTRAYRFESAEQRARVEGAAAAADMSVREFIESNAGQR